MSARRARRVRILSTLFAAGALSAAAAAPAHAGALVAGAPDCTDPGDAQVFMPWADLAYYEPAPGGSLEDGAAGWTLTGSAAVADGNEPYYVGGAGHQSLSIPSGSSATTAEACVGVNKPTVRFFVRRGSASSLFPSLKVDVAYEDAAGNVNWATAGITAATTSWQPSAVMVMAPSLLALLPGEQTPVAIRFGASGGDFVIDDVYIDPFGGH